MRNKKNLFRMAESDYFEHKIPIFGLDYYDPKSHGEHEFSRKQAWFYTYGDEEIKKEFISRVSEMIQDLFIGDEKEWDIITLYPTHSENEVNTNMEDLLLESTKDTGLGYKQVIKRTSTVMESHEIASKKSKIMNLEGSIGIEKSVKGKNIILVDNITLSGTSILHGGNRLLEEGAKNVYGLCLGINKYNDDIKEIEHGKKASEVVAGNGGLK